MLYKSVIFSYNYAFTETTAKKVRRSTSPEIFAKINNKLKISSQPY